MNKQKLEERMQQCNVSKRQAYERLKISRSAFYRKLNGISEFTLQEIRELMSMLNLKSADEIFFDKEVSKRKQTDRRDSV